VAYGGDAVPPADPVREGYTFTGWDTTFDSVTSDMTVTALYQINTYTVTFVNFDGTVLDTQNVAWGQAATPPEVPARDGYEFTGWDMDFDPVTSNLTVTAMFEQLPTVIPDEDVPETVAEEPVPEAGARDMSWMWWLLLIPLLLLLLLLLLLYNVSVAVYGVDENGQEKLLRTIRQLKSKKDEVIVQIKESKTRDGAFGLVELTKPFTKRMRGNRLIVRVEDTAILNVAIPQDAEDRFQARIDNWNY
jgi:hypothetical protein